MIVPGGSVSPCVNGGKVASHGSNPARPPARAIVLRDPVGRRDLRRRRHDEHRHARECRADRCEQIGMDDDRLGAGILEQIARFVFGVVPVHGHGIGADQARRHAGLEEGEVVAQIERDRVAAADAQS